MPIIPQDDKSSTPYRPSNIFPAFDHLTQEGFTDSHQNRYPFDDRFIELVSGQRAEDGFIPILSFAPDPDTGGIIPYETDSLILSSAQFEALVLKARRFYESIDADYIRRHDEDKQAEFALIADEQEINKQGYVPGWIYLIRAENGHCKIGKSRKGTRRAYHFTISLPFSVDVIHQFHSDDHHAAEKRLHERYANKRVNGEWFLLSNEDIAEIVTIGGGR